MNRRIARSLAAVAALVFASVALGQDGETTTCDLSSIATTLGPIAGLIWFILFVKWGGLRYLF